MKRRMIVSIFSVTFLLMFGIGTAFSATVGIREVGTEATEIWVEPCTDFTVELYLELSSTEETAIADSGIGGWYVDIIWDDLVGLTGYDSFYDLKVTDPSTGASPVFEWVGATGSRLWIDGFLGIDDDPFKTSHVLALLDLHCLGFGDTDLIAVNTFDTDNFFLLTDTYDDYLEDLTTVIYQGITIHQTPIPASVLLLASGLLALFGISRRRRR